MCLNVDLGMWVQCLCKLTEVIGSPGARVKGGCEPSGEGAGNRTQILFKSTVCS